MTPANTPSYSLLRRVQDVLYELGEQNSKNKQNNLNTMANILILYTEIILKHVVV